MGPQMPKVNGRQVPPDSVVSGGSSRNWTSAVVDQARGFGATGQCTARLGQQLLHGIKGLGPGSNWSINRGTQLFDLRLQSLRQLQLQPPEVVVRLAQRPRTNGHIDAEAINIATGPTNKPIRRVSNCSIAGGHRNARSLQLHP